MFLISVTIEKKWRSVIYATKSTTITNLKKKNRAKVSNDLTEFLWNKYSRKHSSIWYITFNSQSWPMFWKIFKKNPRKRKGVWIHELSRRNIFGEYIHLFLDLMNDTKSSLTSSKCCVLNPLLVGIYRKSHYWRKLYVSHNYWVRRKADAALASRRTMPMYVRVPGTSGFKTLIKNSASYVLLTFLGHLEEVAFYSSAMG